MLEITNVSICYETREIISDVSFHLEPGRIIALLGANGAGKTTLLRALNGTLPMSKGSILLNEKSLSEYSRREIAQKISVVAQENETKFPVSVLEYVLSGRFSHGTAFGWETENDLRIAENALRLCDSATLKNRLMNRLSGGERQRIVLARALATEAQILLLDEPTANLDLAHQALIFRLVRKRCEDCNSAAVVITHDLNLAAEFADQIILLNRGRIAAKGAPEAVLTEENLSEVFNMKVLLDENPISKKIRVTTIY
ncbi:MAG: transporter ATP-binding protein [Acidobacteria bacterium]|jgi:iron complex transport system ATP-binding protein|nr:transporter ATP-binding protein [Acidobacteriota bacterium]